MYLLPETLYKEAEKQGYIGIVLPDYLLDSVDNYDAVIATLFDNYHCVVRETYAGYEVVALGNGKFENEIEVTKDTMEDLQQLLTRDLQYTKQK